VAGGSTAWNIDSIYGGQTTLKALLRSLILLFVRIYGLLGARRAQQSARSRVPVAPRILLIRPDHLGDLVLTTPALAALKASAPDANLTMMVGPWSSAVVERHPAIDRLITCPFPGFQRAAQKALAPYTLLFRTAHQLRRDRYDIAINLRPDFWWGAALIYLAAIPRRVGYAIAPATPFLTHTLPFTPPEHATVSNLRLLSAGLQTLGYDALPTPYTPTRYPAYFQPRPDEQAWTAQQLAQADITLDTSIVVIHAGTGGAVKLWRTDGWSHIADWLPTNKLLPPPVHIILTGSQQERPMLEEIARGTHTTPLLLTNTTVGQLAAIIARATLVLGVDNGPLHLAAALHRPSLSLFGPTDPRIFGPWGPPDRNLVLASTQKCPGCPFIPCGRLDFRSEELPMHPCVRNITNQAVEKDISRLIKGLSETVETNDPSNTVI
jgi:ADP-heptose:LPS heptosyltransferase